MPLKKTAILEFSIEAFAQHGIEKKSHRTTADAYEVMGSFNWEYRQTHGLILVGRGRNIRIRCSACCKTFKEGVQ